MKGDNNMKCRVSFYFAKDFFFEPSDVNVESYFVKGTSIEECQRKAWNKVKTDYHSLIAQEINVKVVK